MKNHFAHGHGNESLDAGLAHGLDGPRHVDVAQDNSTKNCAAGIGVARQQRDANGWIAMGVHCVSLSAVSSQWAVGSGQWYADMRLRRTMCGRSLTFRRGISFPWGYAPRYVTRNCHLSVRGAAPK